ncbi:MAG: hypothetical protein R2744_07900 [Bacteroidales bacterium]
MELFERWAWYGFYNAFALYLTLSKESGALGFTQVQKGAIIGTGSMLLYFLYPLLQGQLQTGSVTRRYLYCRSRPT